MNTPPFRIIAFFAALLTLFSTAAQAETAAVPKNITQLLQPFVDNQTLAGSVTLVASPEKVLSLEAVGWADIAAKKPMRTDAVFWIASQSKPITGAALMILVDEGKVNVDDPVEKYLPEFRGQMVEAEKDDGHALLKKPRHPITIREVLSHTSGLPFKSPIEYPTLDLFPLELRVRSYAMLPLQFEPGSKSLYSNAGINTAGRIIEVVSGMPFEKFLEARIFKPLGMKDTTFWPTGEQLERVPKSYKPGKEGSLEVVPITQLKYPLDSRERQPMPGGGLFSTATDLSIFYRMLANGGIFEGRRILSEKSAEQMTSDQTGEARGNYGFGIGANGRIFSHGGAYNTNSAYDRESKVITVFLVQHAGWGKDGKTILHSFQKVAREVYGAKTTKVDTVADAHLVVGIPDDAKKSASSIPTLKPATHENFTVYKEPGRYGGWPANHGLWQWGDELVAGYTSTWYKAATNDHKIDRTKPSYIWQARSLDGGRTWKTETALPFADRESEAKPTPLTEPLDFTAPDFALMFRFGGLHAGPSWFYVTNDRCKTWRGPYSFAVEGIDRICTRTDLIVLGPRDCIMFGSCAKQSDGKEGRVFCARTTDGGLTWKLVSLIGQEPTPGGYAIMPSSLRLKDGTLLTTIRRSDPGVSGFIEAWRSSDLGATWTLTGKAAVGIGGNPPALVQLQDGRVAVTYGYRVKPFGVRARISVDGGYSWGPEVVLRDDGHDGDLGYPRSIVRPDGKVMTVYYFNGPRDEDRAIEGTLWTAPDETAALKIFEPKASIIRNGAKWEKDRPVALPGVQRPKVESAYLYQPATEWTYSHHPSITFFKGRFYAIWSNGREHEDEPGQRVLVSSSADGLDWSTPRPLVDSVKDAQGVERVLTAAGFHEHNGTLVAYFGNYGPNKETTQLQAVTTTDGEKWSAVRDIGIPVCPNHGPQRTASGRLIISGNTSLPYTDDPSGLTGWQMTGIYPKSMAKGFKDDPMSFREVAMRQGWPVRLCEASFYQTDDKVLHALLRNVDRLYRWHLWITESRDNGVTWSEPALTDFSDANSKFHFGRLPDGRFYYVGTPLAGNRTPLVLSLSRDGVYFNQHYILGENHYERRKAGGAKGGEYGYPHTLVHEGYLYTIVSRQKEAVEVLRVALSDLRN